MIKKFLSAIGITLFLAGSAYARSYQSPQISSSTGLGIMWLTGNFEIKSDSTNLNSIIILSSTGGVQITYGITAATGVFSGTVTASGLSSDQISFSTFVAAGVTYIPPPSLGSPGDVFTLGSNGAISWSAPTGGDTVSQSIVVGTSSVRGANIIGSDTRAFEFAISSIAGVGDIFVQAGDYYWLNTTTFGPQAHFVFEDSASIKLHDNEGMQTVFYGSGTLTNMQLDISTGIGANDPSVIKPLQGMKIDNLKININIVRLQTGYSNGIIGLDKLSNDVIIDGLTISSFSIVDGLASTNQFHFISIDGSSRTVITDTFCNCESSNNNGIKNAIQVLSADGLRIDGGMWKTNQRILNVSPQDDNDRISGLSFTNHVIDNLINPHSNGMIYLESRTINFSSGTRIANNVITHHVVVSNPTIGIQSPGNSDQKAGSITVSNNTILAPPGSSAEAMKVHDSNTHKTVFIGNQVWGQTFISDSGTNTRYTGLANFADGVEE